MSVRLLRGENRELMAHYPGSDRGPTHGVSGNDACPDISKPCLHASCHLIARIANSFDDQAREMYIGDRIDDYNRWVREELVPRLRPKIAKYIEASRGRGLSLQGRTIVDEVDRRLGAGDELAWLMSLNAPQRRGDEALDHLVHVFIAMMDARLGRLTWI